MDDTGSPQHTLSTPKKQPLSRRGRSCPSEPHQSRIEPPSNYRKDFNRPKESSSRLWLSVRVFPMVLTTFAIALLIRDHMKVQQPKEFIRRPVSSASKTSSTRVIVLPIWPTTGSTNFTLPCPSRGHKGQPSKVGLYSNRSEAGV